MKRFWFADTLDTYKELQMKRQALNWGTQCLLRLANAKLEAKHF